jgi:hypothetical protein
MISKTSPAGRRTGTTDFPSFPLSLLEAIQHGKCVPFVGSGLSLPFGFPTWIGALKHMADACAKEARSNPAVIVSLAEDGDYLLAADKARAKLGEELYARELGRLFEKPVDTGTLDLHRLVWDLGSPIVVTTNFDTLLERAILPVPLVVLPQDKAKLAEVIRDTEQRKLFKLHGSISHFGSVVFSQSDYDKLYSPDENACQVALKTLLLRKAVLFIGFGLHDAAILKQLENSMHLLDGLGCTHYALLRRGEKDTERLWAQYKVHVLEYTDHEDIETILKELLAASKKATTGENDEDRRAEPHRTRAENGVSEPIHIGVSEDIPRAFPLVRHNAIDECIFLLGKPVPGARVVSFNKDFILNEVTAEFLAPSNELADIRAAKLQQFQERGNFPTPRLSLKELHVESLDSHAHGAIRVKSQLTDWAYVDAVQDIMKSTGDAFHMTIRDRFWRSINCLVGNRRSDAFPHHLSTHCLLISSDNRLVLNKRINVSNQRERISASFEEQMQPACVYPPFKGKSYRFINGDESPFHTIARGANEEFGIDLAIGEIKIMALCMEASSIAANFLAIAHSSSTIAEIFSRWEIADDRSENLMITPELSPVWNPEEIIPLLKFDTAKFDEDVYSGRWHASSRARILLGLVHDFGYSALSGKVTWGEQK